MDLWNDLINDGIDHSITDQMLRRNISSIVGIENLKSLRIIKTSKTYWDMFIVCSLILIPIFLVALTNASGFSPLPIFLATISVGVGFNWLNVQIHEASHYLLHADKAVNDRIADAVYGLLGFQLVEEYRSSHLVHHSSLHQAEDPDRFFYQTQINSKVKFTFFLLKCMLGFVIYNKIKTSSFLPGSEDVTKSSKKRFLSVLFWISSLTLIALLFGAISVIACSLVLVVAFCSIFPLLLAIRTWVQHKDADEIVVDRINERLTNRKFVARTSVVSIFEHIFIGARMDYHFEHHLFPRIPHYNLKKLHQSLVALGLFNVERLTDLATDNYFDKSFELLTIQKSF
jgi:fatty acid desaturase